MNATFQVTGMTCGGCAAKVTFLCKSIEGVADASVDLASGQITIHADREVHMRDLENALAPYPKYTVSEKAVESSASSFKTFWPLILIGLFLTGISSLVTWQSGGDWSKWMAIFMGGFFLVFSFFKFLDIEGFVNSYQGYDLLARRWKAYGYIYPFLELGLGIGWCTAGHSVEVAAATVGIMGFSAIGVIQAVMKKQPIQCACLGTVFNLPMTTVTIVEDLLMVGMALWMLLPF